MLFKGIWLNLPTVVFDRGASQMIWLQSILIAYFVASYALAPWRSILVGMLDVAQHAFLIFLFGFVPHFIPPDDPDEDKYIAVAYAFFAMFPLFLGGVVVMLLLRKRFCRSFQPHDWSNSAQKICQTFATVNDPDVLAKILEHLPWYDIITINNTWSILQTTYMFNMHPSQLMDSSLLLKVTSTHTRLQAEHTFKDYMGENYSKSASLSKEANGDNSKEEVNRQDSREEPEAELPERGKKENVKEFTTDDLLDAVDFPDEKMDGIRVFSEVAGLLTPRMGPMTSARSPRDGSLTPQGVSTPRGTPRGTYTPR